MTPPGGPLPPAAAHGPELVVVPRTSDIGGLEVRRALPSAGRRMVGPFVFLDEMGPAVLGPGAGLDVRPHPHVGLATVTYLFDGAILHRDSLASVQTIRAGDVNWMTAGRGITHSERTPPGLRAAGHRLAGLQAWVALPAEGEEMAPAFVHHGREELPEVDGGGWRARVVAGAAFGVQAPTATQSALVFADLELEAGAGVPLPPEHVERAVYVVAGAVAVAGDVFEAGRLLVFRARDDIVLTARTHCRLVLLGGEPLDGKRHVWWNFVSSRRDRIEQAKADWAAGRFPPVVGDGDPMPLPAG